MCEREREVEVGEIGEEMDIGICGPFLSALHYETVLDSFLCAAAYL